MSIEATILALFALLFLSGVFSGSETGFYSLSRVRVHAEANQGRFSSRVIRFLVRSEAGLLITLLIGNNLCLELLTHTVEARIVAWGRIPAWGQELFVALLLAPVVFFFAELLPKDLFHRRPHFFVGLFAPVIAVARVLFLPLAVPLRLLSALLERMLRIRRRELARALGREQVLEVLQEGARTGILSERAQDLALGVLELRATRAAAVMVPWERVERLDLDADEEEQGGRLAVSGYSRLPAIQSPPGECGAGGGPVVLGYVHQLDHLGASAGLGPGRGSRLADHLRPIISLPEDLPVDRALARLRLSGQRIALVGTHEDPKGIVTLKDLVQTISGDLGGW